MNVEIDLRAWRQFAVLAETLHFGRAAERLHMTQPPLTLAIQQLERRLGTPLFARTRRSVALTPAGEALLEPARALLERAAALPALARGAARGEQGRLRLGFVSTVGYGPLPGWLRGFREAWPGVTVELREATGDVQLEAFARAELDAGFVLHAPGHAPALARLSLGVEPMVLALPDAAPRRWRPAELLRQPLVIFPRGIAPSLYDAVLAFYHHHRAAPAIAQEAIQMQTIVNLVSAGLGIALVPRSMTLLQRPGIAYRSLPAALAEAAPSCETSLVWRADAPPAVERFVAHVKAHR
ncbi:MAG: LysR family transcriptional regulator [Piscinibacter sp.]|uniref:LysR family transcriptional regulator n=1 Tax=Piscinibacter sp. TaxID=1903157 RepID=UPI0025865C8C|nr:LysR family transcriptional regulator [Piscinibacter sp.]MCW5662510.1 LysR family transcriptional regulator [Piscinibacter sp.]